MTWGEFKKQVTDGGVTDDMEIDYIDVYENTDQIDVTINADDSFSVT